MLNALLIIAFCAAGYALLMSLALTIAFIVFVIKLRKNGVLASGEKETISEQADEEDRISELVSINYEIVKDLERSDKRTAELLAKLEETNAKVAELALKLTKATDNNKELTARIHELEAEIRKNSSASAPDMQTDKKIRELEELVSHKDQYYADVAKSEKKLRAGVCDAIDSLVRSRGADTTEYLEEQIEKVIKILDASRTKYK